MIAIKAMKEKASKAAEDVPLGKLRPLSHESDDGKVAPTQDKAAARKAMETLKAKASAMRVMKAMMAKAAMFATMGKLQRNP